MSLDVADLGQCRVACEGIDVVVHLAADPSPEADFHDSLLENNVTGTYNIFRAAKDAGCRRVVFASSVHAILGYPDQPPILPDAAVRPMNMYGVSKCFGEAVALQFAYAEGLSSIAIRIGAYDPPWKPEELTSRNLSAYLSRRDMNQLLTRCIETPDIDFAIVHGISNNRIKLLDLTETRALLGYEPQDDGFALHDR
jgi:nucleoside-diphosphate-sugar epimerase